MMRQPNAPRFSRPAWIIALLLAAGLRPALPVSAQQAGRQATGEAQPVTVDFVAVMRDGQPVTDLTPAEVTLKVDGKVRPLKSLEFIRFSSSATGAADSSIAPAFITNTAPQGARSIVLVIDDETMPIGQEHKLREAIDRWLQEVPATDRLALMTVPHGGLKIDLTTDREKFRRAVETITPLSPIEDANCRARTTLLALRTTFETLSRASTQPVVVVFFSSNMAGTSRMERIVAPSAVTGTGGLSTAGGACFLQAEDFKLLGEATAEARILMYVMHPDFNPAPATEGIENLRGVTGAPLLHLSGAGGVSGLSRVGRELAGYYIATFETETGERLGVSHMLDIKSTRRDIEVHARPNIIMNPTRSSSTGPASTFSSAFDLVRSGRMFRDLPLRATASSSRGEKGAVNIISLFESPEAGAKIVSASAALIDGDGRGVAYWNSEGADLSKMPIAVGMTVTPGRYRLRIAAIDAGGRYGVVDDVVTAELQPAGPLTMSGLSLGLSRAGGFQQRLQFSTEASAIAHLELYGGVAGTPVGAVFEVAQTTDGPAMFRVPGVITATSEDDRFSVTGAITVGILPPGDYVIRAIVGVEGKPAGRVIRTLRKVG